MADNPLPSSQTALPIEAAPDRPAEGIQVQSNGAAPPDRATQPSTAAMIKRWLLQRLIGLGVIAALWLVLFVVLLGFFQFKLINAIVFGAILAVVGSFFLRPLLPLP